MEMLDQWLEREYPKLRAKAASLCAHERVDHTLTPTALVNEAYMTLRGSLASDEHEPRYFHASFIQSMKRILIDHARARNCKKRCGTYKRIPIHAGSGRKQSDQVFERINTEEFSRSLEQLNTRAAAVFRIRTQTGLGFGTIAARLGVSRRTVAADWSFVLKHAKDWYLGCS